MSTSEPFLNLSAGDLVCLICGKAVTLRSESKHKKKVKFKSDLSTLKVNAESWKDLDIPDNDRFCSFTSACARIADRTNGYVHTNCQIDFSNKLRYSNYDKRSNDNEQLQVDVNITSNSSASTQHCTRSSLTSPTEKRRCFVCNEKTSDTTSRISQASVTDKAINAKSFHLENVNSAYYNSAKRLDIKMQGTAGDIFAADICYHNRCFQNFNRFRAEEEDDPMIELVKKYFCNYVSLKICKEKNAYLLTDLLNDSKNMSEEHNIDHIFTNTKRLRVHLENNVEGIGFEKSGKYVIVYPSDINPVMYSKSTLKGHGLRKNDIIRAFAKMIQRVGVEYTEQTHIEWPASVDDLISGLANDKPMPELYNAIYMTVYRQWTNSVPLNEYGFAKTHSKNIAEKIWSIASDWTALITGLKNAKQISLALHIQRLAAKKEVGIVLWKAGHAISPNDVRLQNEEFLASVQGMEGILSGLMKDTVTHSSLDNNDMCQDTNTGKNTTHHTNFLLFQPNPPKNGVPLASSAINHTTSDEVSSSNYKIGKLIPPPLIPDYQESECTNLIEECFAKDILWSVAGGLPSDYDEDLPLLGSWTAFMKSTCKEETAKSLLNYLPANENPPEHGVCKEYLEFILEVMGCLSIPRIFVHADEQVYARIVQLIWKYKDRFKNVIPLMGGFHQLRVFQKILFKRHGAVGYQDWYWDSGVIAEGSAPAAFEGRHYYRSMRVHKEGFDALTQYRIEDMTNEYNDMDVALKEKLKTLRKSPSDQFVNEVLQDANFKTLLVQFKQTSDARSKMTIQYLKDISLMLSIVSAVREGCFERHIQAERQFLKLVFAFDHVNYARYNAYQHLFLTNMKKQNHEAYEDLVINGSGCTTTENAKFATKHGDLETEHFNRETKGTAGPFRSGYSTNIHTVNRWIKTSHIHAKLRKAVKKKFRILTSSVHKEMTPKNKRTHHHHVQSLKQKLRDYNAEPFESGPARNLVTGKEIDDNVVKGLLGAEEKGDKQYKQFISERFVSGTRSFFDSIRRNNINTGAEIKKKKSKMIDVLLEEKQAFGIIIAKCKTKEEGFSFPMTTYPLSIAKPDGSLYSSDKSMFRNDLIGTFFTEAANSDALWIIDGGYAIRQIKPRDTYREYFGDLLWWILPDETLNPSAVVIAVDDYRKASTKEGERRSRRNGEDEGKRVYVTGIDQKMPKGKLKWADFLTNGDNKNDLMAVFGEYIKSTEAIEKANGLEIIFCGRRKIWNLGGEKGECNHEEADTKIPLFASQSSKNVVAVAQDCDILVLLITAYAVVKPKAKWQMKYQSEKYADIEMIKKNLGDEVSRYLIHCHALSGCDTTSFFFRLGKKLPFKKAVETGKISLIAMLGENEEISEECINGCKKFIRTVFYDGKDRESYLQTRIRLYDRQPNKSKTTRTIPPDEDSCTQHILRAHHRVFIWKRFNSFIIPDIDPYINGWKLLDGMVVPVWFCGPQFPASCTQNRRKKRSDGYEADDEDTKKRKNVDKAETAKGRKFRRQLKVLTTDNSTKETENNSMSEGVPGSLADDPTNISRVQVSGSDGSNEEEEEDTGYNLDDTDEWEHFSEFENTSDTADSDWI